MAADRDHEGDALAGRHMLVTGAASGIGRAIAELFARQGARLAIFDRDAAGLAQTAATTGAHAFPVDLTDAAATARAVADAARALGALDGVVNCAGVGAHKLLADLDRATWDLVMAVNLTAPYVICQAALPWLKQRPGASIVNIASGLGLLSNAPGASAYAASKAGVIGLTRALAAELAPAIRVNSVCPGIVQTPMTTSQLGGYDNPNDAPFVAQYAMKRVAQPAEIAAAVLFLSSDAASYVTGSALAVDGGRTFH